MEDTQIIDLYWSRSERAIPATAEKYGSYCTTIARNILGSSEDAEECVNDTYLNAWESMPPNRPSILSAFLGRITRNLSVSRYRQNHAEKRGGGELPLVLEELAECVSDTADTEHQLDRKELVQEINRFLSSLTAEKRNLFVCRYWYADSITEIAKQYGKTANHVSVILSRTRKELRQYLTERGFDL